MPARRALHLAVVGLLVTSSIAIAGVPSATASTSAASADRAVGHPDGNVTILRGSHTLVGRLDSPAAVARARDAGRLRQPQYLTPGDLLVLQFTSPRISDALADTAGPTPTVRFFRLLNRTNASLAINELRPGAELQYTRLRLNRSNVAVRHDSESATLSVLVDTRRTELVTRDDGDPVRRSFSHIEFQAVVRAPGDDQRVLAGESQFQPRSVSVGSPTPGVHLDTAVPNTIAPNTTRLTVEGTASLLPNRTVTVALTDGNRTLASTAAVTRDRNRSDAGFGPTGFTTTLDITPPARDDRLTLVVTRENTTLAKQLLVAGQPPVMRNTTARLVQSGPHAGEVAVNTTVRVPAPGFVLVYVNGTPVKTPIPADRRVQRTLYVNRSAVDPETGNVVVYTLWDQDRDGEVGDDEGSRLFRTPLDVGASIRDTELDATVPVANWSAASPTPEGEPFPGTDSPIGTTGTDGPGFGVATALVSVVLCVLLVRGTRR